MAVLVCTPITVEFFSGAWGGRAGSMHRIEQSPLTLTLKSVMPWSDQRHLDCFKHS